MADTGRKGRSNSTSELTSDELREVLAAYPPALRAQIQTIKTGLKRRQLCGAHPCAKACVEVLRNVLGGGGFKNAREMLKVVRLVGRELSSAAPAELTVGNITRRVLFMIREEYNSKKRAGDAAAAAEQRMQHSVGSAFADGPSLPAAPSSSSGSGGALSSSSSSSSFTSTTPPRMPLSNHSSSSNLTFLDRSSRDRDDKEAQLPSLTRSLSMGPDAPQDRSSEEEFSTPYPDLRQAVMAAVNELNDEIDNVYGPICDQAQDHIHAEECVLVSGWSFMVENFLRAAARKRHYHVVVAEGGSLEGHTLAKAICRLPNISVTVIPDGAVYGIMSRINKVIFAPQAVMADGGAICPAGQLMVAVAAKVCTYLYLYLYICINIYISTCYLLLLTLVLLTPLLSLPVSPCQEHHVPHVGLTGAFLLTPLFAHNQVRACHCLDRII